MNYHHFRQPGTVLGFWALWAALAVPLAAQTPTALPPVQMTFSPAAEATTPPLTGATTSTSGTLSQPVEVEPESVVEQAVTDVDKLIRNLQLERLIAHTSLQQWMLALAVASIGLVLGKGAGAILRWLSRRSEARGWPVWQQLVASMSGPTSLAILVVGIDMGALFYLDLECAGPLWIVWKKVRLFFFWLAVIWYIYNAVGIVDVLVHRLTSRTGSSLDQQLAPLVRKTLRSCVVLIGMLSIAKGVFELNINEWLAGLGIAGLAVSLAAQDSLKNIFGTIMILVDRSFRLGETIKCCGYEGTVEEIGFRSTKVRTANGHLVTIPNSSIVSDPVENAARRPYIRRQFDVALAYDTPREKILQAVQLVRSVLEEPGLREPIHATIGTTRFAPRVYFTEFATDHLDLQVTYWYSPPATDTYQEHAQRVNLRIFEVFEQAEIELASPVRTVHLAGDTTRLFQPERLPRSA